MLRRISMRFKVLVCVFALLIGLFSSAFAVKSSGGSGSSIKLGCIADGGTYTKGANYEKCVFPNGDSVFCDTSTHRCDSCINGKCTSSKLPSTRRAARQLLKKVKPKVKPRSSSKPSRSSVPLRKNIPPKK